MQIWINLGWSGRDLKLFKINFKMSMKPWECEGGYVQDLSMKLYCKKY